MVFLANIDLSGNEIQNAVLQPLAVAPVNARLGQIYCDSNSSKIMLYDGTGWKTVGVVVERSAVNGKISVDGVEMTVYELPAASESSLGGIKVGSGLTIDSNGVLSSATDWSMVANKPTALSAFSNDKGFIDSTATNLTNYYLKSQTYTKSEVAELIAGVRTLTIEKVDRLPTSNISNSTIYLLPKANSQSNNVYDEYIYLSSGAAWEKIGSTEVDLTNYLQKTGDAGNTTVAFTQNSSRVLPGTGESLKTIVGKVAKYLSDLKTVAFSGSYSDLSNLPSLVKRYSGTLATTEKTKAFTISGAVAVESVLLRDNVTKEVVFADVVINGNVVTIKLAENPQNALQVEILYTS